MQSPHCSQRRFVALRLAWHPLEGPKLSCGDWLTGANGIKWIEMEMKLS